MFLNIIVVVFSIVRLTEAYYECKMGALDALLAAVGISSATALSFKVACILFVTIVMSKNSTFVKKKFGIYKTYGIDERREVCFELLCIIVDKG